MLGASDGAFSLPASVRSSLADRYSMQLLTLTTTEARLGLHVRGRSATDQIGFLLTRRLLRKGRELCASRRT